MNHIDQTVANAITMWEELASENPPPPKFANMDCICERKKSFLKDLHVNARRTLKHLISHDSPPGILLYGPQGVGKTELARSWCVEVRAVLIQINSLVRGITDGQTEKILKTLFEKAVELSKSQAVILHLDNVDYLLSSTNETDHLRVLQANLKGLFNTIMESNHEIYIFGATNWPERINMQDWGSHFGEKWHLTLPRLDGRKQIMQDKLATLGEDLSNEELEELACAMDNWSAFDIQMLISDVHSRRRGELRRCERWKESEWRGEKVVVPASKDDVGDEILVGARGDLPEQDRCRVRYRPISGHMLMSAIRGIDGYEGTNATCSGEEIEKHSKFQKSLDGDDSDEPVS